MPNPHNLKCPHGPDTERYAGGRCKQCAKENSKRYHRVQMESAPKEYIAKKTANRGKTSKWGKGFKLMGKPLPMPEIVAVPGSGFTAGTPGHEAAVAAGKGMAQDYGRMAFYVIHDQASGKTWARFEKAGSGQIVERWERATIGASWTGQPWGVRHVMRPCPIESNYCSTLNGSRI